MVGKTFNYVAFIALLVLFSAASAVVIESSIIFLSVLMICGFYIERVFIKESFSFYFAFVALSSMMVQWFVVPNYWYLNIWMAGMPLNSCKLIVASIIMAIDHRIGPKAIWILTCLCLSKLAMFLLP